jgi:hypothetical protein
MRDRDKLQSVQELVMKRKEGLALQFQGSAECSAFTA